ncbi:KilA-N domain protein (modular protein) [Candidatus Glomeribacter gigasporarum BEG34]|uniref:KilA-N domain protein (Modular protein) n=1 Tax=Candidatus Glomeribacter gigasporarum BEG34 TaxID=1070319 RepID=G2J829_9BURK|nr:KilA-N domain-containing protein [Candidatus Glomeribacter gigasporarum]CCD28926.1 KilA-N domain protein (modular protein) [Candidatus Glomeribacter gigasporarum BEG34]
MNTLMISKISIQQDAEGRYCLNDLHKASGGEDRHKPANFLRLDTTQALIAEINGSHLSSLEGALKTDGIPSVSPLATEEKPYGTIHFSDVRSAVKTTNGGHHRGTYVCKELVYAYAMWVSSAFHLKVIRTFNALATRRQESVHSTPLATFTAAFRLVPLAMRAARALGLDKNAAALSVNQFVHKLTHIDLLSELGHTHLIAENQKSGQRAEKNDAGQMIGLKTSTLKNWLQKLPEFRPWAQK